MALAASDNVRCSKCGQPGDFRPGHLQCWECEKLAGRQRYRQNKEVWEAYREKNREKYRKQNVDILRRRKAERHRELGRLKSAPCADCGKSFPPYVMDFDHKDPSTKEYEINFLVNKTSAPWTRILEEISKCDVVCACCHRMRTWKAPKSSSPRQRLRVAMKNRPCGDCGGFFHYCQMDFDHVRGEKIREVSHCTSLSALLDEAAKCDVVCANCHRERTHQHPKGTPRLSSRDINMQWKQRSRVELRTELAPPSPKKPPAPKPWHALAGTMPDEQVARIGGVVKSRVCQFRATLGIRSFRVSAPGKVSWHEQVGTMPDGTLAILLGVSRRTVVRHRLAYGLPVYGSTR